MARPEPVEGPRGCSPPRHTFCAAAIPGRRAPAPLAPLAPHANPMPNAQTGPESIQPAQYESRENEVFSNTFEANSRSFPGHSPHVIAQNRAVFSLFVPRTPQKRPWRHGNAVRPSKNIRISGYSAKNIFGFFPARRNATGGECPPPLPRPGGQAAAGSNGAGGLVVRLRSAF